MRWAGNIACMGTMRNEYTNLVGKSERKRLGGRPMCKWEDDLKMGFRKIG